MNAEKLLFQAAQLNAAEQAEFIERIRPLCSSDELTALLVAIGYFRQLQKPDLKSAIQAALAKDLYNKFQMDF